MIKLEKNLDPDFYHTFYPKEAEHKEAIIWKALCQDGKEEYSRWLGSKIFEQKSVLKEQADKLKTTLEQVKLIPPVDLKPFVYVRISEHPDIPLEEAMPLNQAVECSESWIGRQWKRKIWQVITKHILKSVFSQRGKSCLIPGARILVTGKEICWIM